MKHPRSIAFVIVAWLLATVAQADSVTIEPSQDNTLYETATGSLSNGKGFFLFCGRHNSSAPPSVRRTVLKFDIAGNVPAGARIDSVSLTLNASRVNNNTARKTELHRVLRAWGEGSSDAPGQEGQGTSSTTGDATWIHTSFNKSFWTNIGGDFFPTASATTNVGGIGFYTWASSNMIAEVQDFLDNPANNFGWILIGNEVTFASTKRFDSRENGTTGNRPKLTIQFCPLATWSNYGSGLPGTLGVPSITSSNPPVLCTTVTMSIANSRGVDTPAALFLGFVKASIPSAYGGDLLLVPVRVFTFSMPAAGASFPFNVICDDAFCGVSIYMQCLELDPGAIRGVSFTQGIDFDHGL